MPVLVDGELVLYGFCGADDWLDEGFTDRDVLDALAELGRESDITVRLNSGGGFTDSGKAIFNALRAHAGRVTVFVDAIAASSASLIAMAGDEIVMRAGSLMMIHEANGATFGDADEHRRTVEWLERESLSMASIYAERTGGAIHEMRALMRAETWMTAEEAVGKGFASRTDAAAARAVAAFDYRAYAHAPKGLKAKARQQNWSLEEVRRAVASATGNPRQQRKDATMTEQPSAEGNNPAPPPPPAAAPPAPAPAASPAVADLDAARAEGRAAALAYVTEVTEICRLAGLPDRAENFIGANTALAEVRRQLLEARATADAGRQIATQTPAAGGAPQNQKGALAAGMKRLIGKEA